MGYEDAVGNTTWSGEYFFKVGTLSSDAMTIPAGTTVADFTIAAFTAWPASPDAEIALKIDYDNTTYRIGTYDPVSGAYIECGSGLTIEPGRAYWFLSREGMNAGIDGVPVSKTEDIEVKLGYNAGSGNGWNMISPPNGAKYYWDDLQVVVYDPEDGSVIDGPTSISQFPDDYIGLRIWRWENGGYASASVGEMFKLNHHQGYWVKAKQPNVSLIFDHSVQTARLPIRDRMLVASKHHLNRLIEESIFSPASAFAADGDSPPSPMAGFGGSSGYSEAGGGACFLNTAASGSRFDDQVKILWCLAAVALLTAATAGVHRRLKRKRV